MITRWDRIRLKWLMINYVIPSWTDLRGFGSSRLLKTSYFWMILVPLAAKLLAHMPNELHIPLLEKTLTIGLGLPFSWKVLFFSSLSFSVANSIYSIWCPRIVKEYRTFADYNADRWSLDRITDYFVGQNLKAHGNTPEGFFAWFDAASEFFSVHSTAFPFPPLTKDLSGVHTFLGYIKNVKIDNGHDRQAFFETLENANDLMKPFRAISWFFYVVGFALMGILLIQNVIFVITE